MSILDNLQHKIFLYFISINKCKINKYTMNIAKILMCIIYISEFSLIKADMINDLSNFIDKHLQLIRGLTIVTGCVGVILISKRYHLTKQYQYAKDIPNDFITKRISLRGTITGVNESGNIHIRNQPILSIRKNDDSPSLPFLLAGVELKEGWFDHVNQLKGEKVNFTILENDQKFIKGVLHHNSKGFFPIHVCLNEELIKNGLAVTHCNLELSSQTYVYHDLTKKLLKYEIKADRKGVGVWSQDQPESVWKRFKNSFKWLIKYRKE